MHIHKLLHYAAHSVAAGLITLSALSLPQVGAATAVLYEDHGRIKSLAEAHARAAAERIAPNGATISAEAARLDPRMRLPACDAAPETFSPTDTFSSNTTVGVRCTAGATWSLYVPVRIEISAEVLVLAVPLSRGETLSADALRLDKRNVAQLTGGYLTAITEAAGMVLLRPARTGTVLTASLLERPRLVRRGERVRILAGDTAIAVRSEGEALADAAEGDRLRVRNTRSGLTIEGIVDSSGTVVARWR